jgi:hypothetical protein
MALVDRRLLLRRKTRLVVRDSTPASPGHLQLSVRVHPSPRLCKKYASHAEEADRRNSTCSIFKSIGRIAQIENPPEVEFGRALSGVKHDTFVQGPQGKCYYGISRRPIKKMSAPTLRFPDKKNESCDQSNHDKHPVLAIET